MRVTLMTDASHCSVLDFGVHQIEENEMNTKYDWSNISKQVKFIIIDSDGTEYHLKKKPNFKLSNRYKTGSWFFNNSSIFAWFNYKHANSEGAYPDFTDSLEERPQ